MTEELKQLREALRRVKHEAASLADAQVIALEALTQRPAAQATPEPVGEPGQFPPMPEGWPARFRCASCYGNGEIGELVSMGDFQPPERQTCPDCGGRGWTSEEPAFNAEHVREFAEAHARNNRPAPGVPEPVGEAPIWNSIQIASWIGSQLMHEPAMFERAAVCKFVRSLGRHTTLLKHSPKDHASAPGVPEGFALVPVEPTLEMLKAMESQWLVGSQVDMANREYAAMLAAAQAKGADHG